MRAQDFFKSKHVSQLLTQYLDGISDVPGIMNKISNDLDAAKCIICVFGTQGSGKSSFLNALLFRSIVLPVDADETTCIPVSVSYGKNKAPSATVSFQDGRKEAVPCTEEALAQYIHQNYNRANEKKVREVEIRINHPLLKEGVTFVDLPGVGSITPANQQVALDYLKQATAAVFMLRLGQPITNSDSFFIRYALPLFNQVFWLQNRWVGETDEEVFDGKSYNEDVLKDIARKIHYPEERLHELDIVNIQTALDAAARNDRAGVRESGFEAFEQKLSVFASQWKKDLEDYSLERAGSFVRTASGNANARIQRLSDDVQKTLKQLEKEKASSDKTFEENRECRDRADAFLREQTSEIMIGLEKQCRQAYGNLRNAVRNKIESGIVGGEYLNKAFQDCLNIEEAAIYEYVRSNFQELEDELRLKYLDNMKEPSLNGSVDMPEPGKFSDKSKLPGYYNRIGTGIGGLAGGFGGGFVGAKIGALVGSAVAPGVGTAVGAVVGVGIAIVGTLLGNLAGNGARKLHLHYQKEEAKKELFKIISEYTKKAKTEYQTLSLDYCRAISAVIDEWLQEQRKSIDRIYAQRKAEIEKPVKEKRDLIRRIRADIKELERIGAEL